MPNSHRPPDTTKQSCLRRVWRDSVNWTIATNESATVLSCPESNSHRQSGRDTDKTVLSRLTWRCELALTLTFALTRL